MGNKRDKMRWWKAIALPLVVVVPCAVIAVCQVASETPIEQYTARNADEARIVALIRTFHQARTDYDLDGYLACLDENGRFMFGGGVMVSKRELARRLPDFWSDLRSGDPMGRPFAHECQNGNYFNGALYDPVITLSGDSGTAAVTFRMPIIQWKTMLFIDLLKVNGHWKISKFEWDKG